MKTYRLGHASQIEYRAIREQNLCDVMTESSRLRFVKTGELRCPKKGEWYLSGAIPEVYCSPVDMNCECIGQPGKVHKWHIMRPIGIAETHTVEVLKPLLRDKK